MKVVSKKALPKNATEVRLVSDFKPKNLKGLTASEKGYVSQQEAKSKNVVLINRYDQQLVLTKASDSAKTNSDKLESLRIAGNTITGMLNDMGVKNVVVNGTTKKEDEIYALCEGIMLGNYQFLKYKTKPSKNSLKDIGVIGLPAGTCKELQTIVDATFLSRDLVNEPVRFLNAVQLSKEIKKAGKRTGIKVTVFNKAKIESLRMGGLLAVNQGSVDPPTFSIMEWKPANPVNKAPIVLVGKGVVYDTGGLDIKTNGVMANMKCDMAGAAAMIGAMYAIAGNKLPLHVIALLPSTDNRPGKNAYAAGDVIKMYSGKTVEVINTDAEGRMILADALSFANKYKPELVIDAATLTGAAARAFGTNCMAGMGNADGALQEIAACGLDRYERVAVLPFWDDYNDMLKSEIADIKHLGGAAAGAITAGKFLEHFTEYPYVHLDIAGPAMLDKREHYRTSGGSGVGVRLLFEYMKRRSSKK